MVGKKSILISGHTNRKLRLVYLKNFPFLALFRPKFQKNQDFTGFLPGSKILLLEIEIGGLVGHSCT